MLLTSLIPWRKHDLSFAGEVDPITSMWRDMDHIFRDFSREFALTPLGDVETRAARYLPRVDVTETENEIRISAELPGMEEKDIDVSVLKDTLTLRGEKKTERKEEGRTFYRMERAVGAFERAIDLPCEVESDKAEATFKNGILNVKLPKTAEARRETKRIKVKAE